MAIKLQQMVDAAEAALVAELQAAHDLALVAAIGVKDEEMAAAIAANDDQWFSTLNTQLAAKDAEIASLQQSVATLNARIAELEAAQPTPTPEPEPEPEEPAPTPVTFWRGLQTDWGSVKTGVGPRVSLTPAANNTPSGTVVGRRFTGVVRPASNTTLVDCEINGCIDCTGRTNVKVDHCRVRGAYTIGIYGASEVTFCDISGSEDGFRPSYSNLPFVFRRNWVHDLGQLGSDPHNDGLQCFDGPGLIEENYIDAIDTSAVMVQSWDNKAAGAPSGIVIRYNWLGGAGLPLRIESECINKGNEAYDNVIVKGSWGWHDISGSPQSQGRNIDSVTGAAI